MTRILVVEDNVAVLEGIVFGLKMRGFDLLEATSGSEALALLESADPLPEVIVSDIAMPDIDGYQLLEEVQNNPRWQSIPFIILSDHASSVIEQQSMNGRNSTTSIRWICKAFLSAFYIDLLMLILILTLQIIKASYNLHTIATFHEFFTRKMLKQELRYRD